MVRRSPSRSKASANVLSGQPRKRIPFEFVLDELEDRAPTTRPMFGCTAVYLGEVIVCVLRQRGDDDDGVWLATTKEHHASLRGELPHLRSIGVLGAGVTGWQVLPASAPDFEESVLHACELVRRRDPRIGKVPAAKKKKRPRAV
jgi:hypothetical protein